MLSKEQIEAYRRMTPEERWRQTEALTMDHWKFLLSLPRNERERILKDAQEEKDKSDAAMLEHLRKYG